MAAALSGAAALLIACTGLAAARGWSRPVALVPPAPEQVVGSHIAFSSSGQAAVGFGLVDPDHQTDSQAWVALVSARGHAAPARRLSGARQVLDLAFLGTQLRVLAGTGAGMQCCSSARVMTLGARGFTPGPTLARGLAGTVLGHLLVVGRGMLVALADATQLRVLQAGGTSRFGPVHRLTPRGTAPRSLTAAALSPTRTLLSWIADSFAPQDTPSPESIMVATGSASHVPGPTQTVLTLPSGHSAGQLALAGGPRASLAWVEDWSDDTGAYESEVSVAALGSAAAPVSFSTPGTVQSGLTAAGDGSGDQLLAWSACDVAPACQVMMLTRSAHGSFGTPVALGPIDAGAAPSVVLQSGGAGAVGWISAGRVMIAWRRSAGAPFTYTRLADPAHLGYAQDLTLTAGPSGRILATWSDGSPRQTLEVSLYSPR